MVQVYLLYEELVSESSALETPQDDYPEDALTASIQVVSTSEQPGQRSIPMEVSTAVQDPSPAGCPSRRISTRVTFKTEVNDSSAGTKRPAGKGHPIGGHAMRAGKGKASRTHKFSMKISAPAVLRPRTAGVKSARAKHSKKPPSKGKKAPVKASKLVTLERNGVIHVYQSQKEANQSVQDDQKKFHCSKCSFSLTRKFRLDGHELLEHIPLENGKVAVVRGLGGKKTEGRKVPTRYLKVYDARNCAKV